MGQAKNSAASDLELDTSAKSGDTAQQDNGNQDNSGNGGQSGSGNGGKNEAPGSDKKIGLAIFIQKESPNKYVIAVLKNKRAMEVHTLAEWRQIVKDLLEQKVG